MWRIWPPEEQSTPRTEPMVDWVAKLFLENEGFRNCDEDQGTAEQYKPRRKAG